ncbi:hypothetical protein [Phytoactinopolyspora halotolerans]|uniref:Uncharacterized protein n=1 Tax=Phytoactinopolyspora halotolerans TaxID=1981512 RepID=A0A6L9SAE1_9ACTN|nr:hypothetical protein [Phytoactinopolyspora halotolerans]NEE02087.1 hypothetical protein [Phytoactinopolyspora halotolerans]
MGTWHDETDDELATYERTFRRSGLPLFIEDYSASDDIFNRAAPFLALVFIAEMLGAIDFDWPLLVNVAAALGGLAVLVVAFGILNRLLGRGFWTLPSRIGRPELAAFVFIPALLPLIFGGQLRQVAGIIVGNSLLLGLVYLVVGYGLIATVFWALTRIADELAESLSRLVRALPLLLIFSLVLFLNAEMWQVFSTMPRTFVWIVVGLFVGLGGLFVFLRVPGQVRQLEGDARGDSPPLSRRQRINVGLTLLISQGLQVFVVAVGVGLFFIAFGALTVGEETRVAWDVNDGLWSQPLDLLGHEILITEALLRVAAAMAAITGLYYAISILTDATYREEFLEDMTGEMREVFQARARYLELRTMRAADGPAEPVVSG